MPDGASVFYPLVCLSASSRLLRSLSREAGVGMSTGLHVLVVFVVLLVPVDVYSGIHRNDYG